MLTTTAQYDVLVDADLRPIAWAFYAAFEKVFNFDVDFFTLDDSILDGTDILSSEDSDVITEWDKYSYKDYSDRVIQLEWTREEDIPYSVTKAMADLTLKNEDNFFTYGVPALAESFYDNFDNGLSNLWNRWGSTAVVDTGGEVVITVGPLEGYRGMNSEYGYDLTGSFFSCEVVDAGNQASANYECIPVELVNLIDPNDGAKIAIENGTLYSFKKVNTVQTQVDNVAYDDNIHKFFRIREASGSMYWEYSTDSVTWNTLHSEALSFEVTNTEVNVSAGYFNDDVIESVAIFDNFNTNASGEQLGTQNISPISSYNLPRRPIRLFGGFSDELLPQFVGLTETSPQVDRASRTATLHAEDFLAYIFNTPLDEAIMLTNVTTSEVLAELFDSIGLLASQYVLDVAYNEIAFVYFEKGKKLGDAIRDLMQAEMGTLYMDEQGIIRFINRIRVLGSPDVTFNSSNIVDYKVSDESKIINVVEVKANVREVQPIQQIYTLPAVITLNPGTTEVFFNFEDPVTSVDTIDEFEANTLEDGTGTDITADVSITSVDVFANAVKVTFNNSGLPGFLTLVNIYGTPAKVVKEIYLRVQDDDSVEQFEEQPLLVENDYLQSDLAANSFALSILNYYKDYAGTIELEVKGNFALQVGDSMLVQVDNIDQEYMITKIVNTLEDNRFRQIIHGRADNIPEFFVLDQSVLDGETVLTP